MGLCAAASRSEVACANTSAIGVPKANERADDRAQLGHVADRGDAMARDVADDQRIQVVIDDDALVPVATHPDVCHRREVAGRDVEVGGARQWDEQAVLQGGDHPVLSLRRRCFRHRNRLKVSD